MRLKKGGASAPPFFGPENARDDFGFVFPSEEAPQRLKPLDQLIYRHGWKPCPSTVLRANGMMIPRPWKPRLSAVRESVPRRASFSRCGHLRGEHIFVLPGTEQST